MSDRYAPADQAAAESVIVPFQEHVPRVAEDVFIAPGAAVAGDVEVAAGASVWFNATVRGDVAPVRIGERTNIQDGAVLHVDPGVPCILGRNITVGHGAIVHGAIIGDDAMIGMGAIVLSRSRIGAGAIVAAGALVPEGAEIADGMLVMGVPARPMRLVRDDERQRAAGGVAHYAELAAIYRRRLKDTTERISREASHAD